MIKKVRYITITEFRRICEVSHCYDCPLFDNDEGINKKYVDCVLDILNGHLKRFSDKEIEIPEESE